MTILSTFLEQLYFPYNNLQKTLQNLVQSGRKAVSKFELKETQFERTVKDKSLVKPTWSKKMTVLSTFLESSLNFLSNNLEKVLQNLV